MRRPARSLALGGLLIAAALGFILYQGLASNLVYYITPSELLAKGPSANGQSFRLGGQVKPGSVHWNPTTEVLAFVLQDPKSSVKVTSRGSGWGGNTGVGATTTEGASGVRLSPPVSTAEESTASPPAYLPVKSLAEPLGPVMR